MAKHELGMLLNRKIKKISADADRLLDAGDYGAAVERYNDAFELLPTPKEQWNASLWLLGSIGNAAFFGQDYDFARGVLQDAISLPDGLGNAFIHLRLGTCHFELEDLDTGAVSYSSVLCSRTSPRASASDAPADVVEVLLNVDALLPRVQEEANLLLASQAHSISRD